MEARLLCAVSVLLLTAGCAPDAATANGGAAAHADRGRPHAKAAASDQPRSRPGRKLVDPRKGGFEIALGEWALSPEADAIRPGRVTFVIHNRGTMAHGFEIALEGESSGHGSGDLFKAEGPLLRPGSTTKMTLDLGPGLYEIECLVDGHDDMGMEGVLDVRTDAPLVKPEQAPAGGDTDAISIKDFAYSPQTTTVERGTEVTWHNEDVAPHTVTSTEDVFDSDTLGPDASFAFRFDEQGTYQYRCLVHPDMKGSVTVR